MIGTLIYIQIITIEIILVVMNITANNSLDVNLSP